MMTVTSWLCSFFDFRTLLISVGVILFAKWLYNREKNLPPGPWGIPILGYLPFLRGNQMHKTVTELGQKYGNVMSFYLGSVLVIVLGDYSAIKEAFAKQGVNFSGKPLENNVFKFRDTDKGFGIAEGEEATEFRRFTLSTLKDLGMGKTSLEPKIMNEIRHFLQDVSEVKGQPVDLHNQLVRSIANVILTLEFGHRHEYENEDFKKMVKISGSANEALSSINAFIFLPWTKYIPFFKKIIGFNKLVELGEEIRAIFKKQIQSHEDNYTDGSTADYIDAHLTKKKTLEEKTGSVGYFGEEALIGNLGFLFGAGVDSTSTTLLWSFLYMMKYPNIMKKIQQEIDDVIGIDNEPSTMHMSKMPYTEATLCEILRSSVPFSLVHSNMEETTLFGFRIPKRSFVLGNLWASNQSQWNDPEKFCPDRFIDANGLMHKPEHFIPFSIGKRSCPGESMAHMQLFLYFTAFFQQFSVQVPPNETLSMDYTFGISLLPKPFKVCAIPRHG